MIRLGLGLVLGIVATVAAATTLAVAPASRGPSGTTRHAFSSAASIACGAESVAVTTDVDVAVAREIYETEMHGREVSAGMAHIEGSQVLRQALAGNSQSAVYAAVHAIVYTPHWHIVRLRVIRSGRVLADVGGPDVIAPVSGALTHGGKTPATFVMSVQDDAGYVKLVSRFIGVPVDLYGNGSFLMGTFLPAPSKVGGGGPISLGSSAYQSYAFDTQAFPSGALRVALFVPTPARSLAAESCVAVRLAAWGSIARHIAARLIPLQAHYQALVDLLRGTSGGLAYVFSGSRRIAGGAGPARIPARGVVRYRGRSWAVFSWDPSLAVRVFLLTPVG